VLYRELRWNKKRNVVVKIEKNVNYPPIVTLSFLITFCISQEFKWIFLCGNAFHAKYACIIVWKKETENLPRRDVPLSSNANEGKLTRMHNAMRSAVSVPLGTWGRQWIMTRNDEGVSRVEALDRHMYLVNETRAPINVQCSLLPILLAHTLTCTYIGSAKRSIAISTMNYHRHVWISSTNFIHTYNEIRNISWWNKQHYYYRFHSVCE